MGWLIPTDSFGVYLLAALTAGVASAVAVVVHYEGVHWLARRYSRRKIDITGDRIGVHRPDEVVVETLFDAFYLSATTFTTLGFGDLTPMGAVRVLSGCEALTGLLLITWSASFTYLEMARLWNERDSA